MPYFIKKLTFGAPEDILLYLFQCLTCCPILDILHPNPIYILPFKTEIKNVNGILG